MSLILLVEDNPNQQALYEEALAEWGYEVVVAQSGEEALLTMVTSNADLVVMDISMKGMGGAEAMSRILAMRPHTPVIVNTAYGSYQEDALSRGAHTCLVKSSDLSELKDAVQSALESGGKGPG